MHGQGIGKDHIKDRSGTGTHDMWIMIPLFQPWTRLSALSIGCMWSKCAVMAIFVHEVVVVQVCLSAADLTAGQKVWIFVVLLCIMLAIFLTQVATHIDRW